MGDQKIGLEGLGVDDCRELLRQGRIAEGLQALEVLAAAGVESGALEHYLAVALHMAGRSREALPHFERAHALEPDQPSVYQNQAMALLVAGEPDQARVAAEKAIALKPDQVGGYANLALAQSSLGDLDGASETIRKGLLVVPGHPSLLLQASQLALDGGRLEEAERLVTETLAVVPDSFDARFNLARLHHCLGRDEEAAREYDALLKRQPDHQSAYVNAGVSLRNLGLIPQAIRHFSSGLERWPDWLALRYNLAVTRLYAGDWQTAWPDYELRTRLANALAKAPKPQSPQWDGGDIAGKTLLVVHEQGFGDVFQFIRLLTAVRAPAGRVIFVAPARLFALLSRLEMFSGDLLTVVSDAQPLPQHDVHIHLLSLLGIAPVGPDAVPVGISNINLEADRLDRWRAFAPASQDKPWRVGLAWQGNPQADVDRGRSFSPAQLAPLAGVAAKVQFISLQRFVGLEQPLPEALDIAVPGADFDSGADGFLDTAAMIMSLDLVITSDTSVAHLAGLLGRPVWLFLKKVPDWRWGGEGLLTPWYPTMRLFRQNTPGDWKSLFEAAAADLDGLVARADAASKAAAVRVQEAIEMHSRRAFAEAAVLYRAALGSRPREPQLFNFLAMAVLEDGRRSPIAARAGLAFAAHSVALAPGSGDFWSNYAVLLENLGGRKDAIRALRFGLLVSPGHQPAMVSLAKKESAAGNLDKALDLIKQVLSANPKSVSALSALATVYIEHDKPRESERALRKALDLTPDDAKLWVQLGANQSAAERHAEAAESWEHALTIDPLNSDAFSNLGVYERNYGELGLSVYLQRRAIEVDPGHAEGWNNLGISELEAAHDQMAMAAFRQAIALRPGYADAHLALGMTFLNAADYEQGLKHYEFRLRSDKLGIAVTKPNLPYWTGGDPTGKKIFLMAEQGFGDAFQFSRYAIWLKAHGAAKVFIGCRTMIGHLLGTIPGVDGIFGDGDKLPKADAVAFMMSMPYLTGMRIDTIPAFDSYMTAEPARVTRWAEWLAQKPGFRVGVVWQGNPDPKVDKGRSYPLAALEPLAKIPGVRLIALQKGKGEEQIAALDGRFAVEQPGPDFDSGAQAFADTAAMMMNLDLIVTSDTAVAHLAGALGRPCWVVLKAHPEWRWLTGRADSPWYPETRVFRRFEREQEPAPFAAVMGRLAAALEKLAAGDLSQRYRTEPDSPGPIAAFDPAKTFNTALEVQRRSDWKAAEAGFAEVLDYKALRQGALHMLGVIALHRDRNHRAVMLFREAERAGLASSEFLTNFSIGMRRIGRPQDALNYLRKAIAQKPTAEAHLSLGNVLRDECQWQECLENYQASIALKPDLSKAHRGLGNLMRDMHRPQESLAAFEQARKLDPNDPDLVLDHAHAKLFAGDFPDGFRDYEARWRSREMKMRNFNVPRWDGSPQPDKCVMIHGEQGFGDNIQFVRFVEAAAARAGRTILEVRAPLISLFKTLVTSVPIEIAEQGRGDVACDFEMPMLSLPVMLGTTIDSLPPPARFAIAPERVAAWRERFPKTGTNVGMIWQGNPKARADQGRSPPLAELVPLLDVAGVNFISLQKTDGLDQVESTPFAGRMIVPGASLGDFAETAAAILALDVVISSCTATLHLAASLGVPVFGMLKYHADWRWLNERDDSPWYPSLRLFRQEKVFDWKSVADPMAAALSDLVKAK
jgi:tetratricopeptide (TPR) repeat protein